MHKDYFLLISIALCSVVLFGFGGCHRNSSTSSNDESGSQPAGYTVIEESKKIWTFEDAIKNAIPTNLFFPTGSWKAQIMADALSPQNVLVQRAKRSGSYYNLAVIKDAAYKDLRLSVQIKALAGEEDQGGGPVWRYQDSENYYIARTNPLEDNYRLYKVVEGSRKMLKSASLKIAPGWHEVRIEMVGTQIRCFYDGKEYLQAQDDTFKSSGQIGVWTKADAQTAFADLTAYEIQ